MKQNIVLSIDTSDMQKTIVRISKEDITYEKVSTRHHNAQRVLSLIENLLGQHDLHLKDITQITVHTGPGSYTGLRVGIAGTKTLATLLQIPLNGTENIEKIIPLYSMERLNKSLDRE